MDVESRFIRLGSTAFLLSGMGGVAPEAPSLRRHSCMPSAAVAVMGSPSAQWLVPYRSGPFADGIA